MTLGFAPVDRNLEWVTRVRAPRQSSELDVMSRACSDKRRSSCLVRSSGSANATAHKPQTGRYAPAQSEHRDPYRVDATTGTTPTRYLAFTAVSCCGAVGTTDTMPIVTPNINGARTVPSANVSAHDHIIRHHVRRHIRHRAPRNMTPSHAFCAMPWRDIRISI